MAATPKAKGTGASAYTVLASVSGLRDGVAWPAIGELIALPADEAAAYVLFGYVEANAGSTPVAAAVAEPVAEPVAAPETAA